MLAHPRITVARGFWQRFLGLMLSRPLPPLQALLIPHCASVHTFFMRYALDLAYLDQAGVVVELVPHLKPWRPHWAAGAAAHTLEMAGGGIARMGLQVGDVLLIPSAKEVQHAQPG